MNVSWECKSNEHYSSEIIGVGSFVPFQKVGSGLATEVELLALFKASML